MASSHFPNKQYKASFGPDLPESQDRIDVDEGRQTTIAPGEIDHLIQIHIFHAVIGPAIEQNQRAEPGSLLQIDLVLLGVVNDATSREEVDVLSAQQYAYLVKGFPDLCADDLREMRILMGRHESAAAGIMMNPAGVPKPVLLG